MLHREHRRVWAVCGSLLLWATGGPVQAFQGNSATATAEVVIKRELLKLTDPRQFKVSLTLEPVRQIQLTASQAGIVQQVGIRLGVREAKGVEAFRLDNGESVLQIRRARSNLQVARIEKRLAETAKTIGQQTADQLAIADARFDVAQAEVELAELRAQKLILRMPQTAQVTKIFVQEGQGVQAGDPLATLMDVSRLQAEIPLEKVAANIGGNLDINIEQHPVRAKIDAVLPLNPRFDVLRELGDELVSVVVSFDNLDGKYLARQAVYTSLQPFDPVTVVPTTTVSNDAEGHRKVQVLRDNIVRNIAVKIHAKVGTERVYVSGKFRDGDELIVNSSKELTDGTPVRPAAIAATPRTEDAAGAGKGTIHIGPSSPSKGTKEGF